MKDPRPLEKLSQIMKGMGADRILYKLLANNDNSKQQVYMGSDEILRVIPHSDMEGSGSASSKDGIGFKAKIDLHWIDPATGRTEPAPGSQLILYPKYPEVRLSGFIRGCRLAPAHLMRPPSADERLEKMNTPRCLVLGVCPEGKILAYLDTWGGSLARDAQEWANGEGSDAFQEYRIAPDNSRDLLLQQLQRVYHLGSVPSQKLDEHGNLVPYQNAQNGAGVTLEALLGIRGNGRSEPDFMDWELKTHGRSPVTMLTPEPDSGLYLDDFDEFLERHHSSRAEKKINFAAVHHPETRQNRTGLKMVLSDIDMSTGLPMDPEGGIFLLDDQGHAAIGWSFNKLISHWSRKHAKTAFVHYTRARTQQYEYAFGPEVRLCTGNSVRSFLKALSMGNIYYDPPLSA